MRRGIPLASLNPQQSDHLCECGCGAQTLYGKKTGEPNRYLLGHHPRRNWRADVATRFWGRVVVDSEGCWVWQGACLQSGYGRFVPSARKNVLAHRWAYESLIGPVPEGLELDHLCRVRACVNPAHLEAVTHQENVLRGEGVAARASRQTHCVNGHPLSGENLRMEAGQNGRPRRRCIACQRDRYAASRAAKAA